MKTVLLIGSGGQVGQELQSTLSSIAQVIPIPRESLDLTQLDRVRETIQKTCPHLIINAAAYTAVDRAESEPELATVINSDAPTVMAEEAAQMGAALIHISTDYVFDGSKNTPYTETDRPNPIGAYGKSKLLGEQGIQQVHATVPEFRYVILRTAWVYGALGKSNFVKTMLRLGSDREEVRVVSDQVGTPTWAADIAKAITVLSSHWLSIEAEDPTTDRVTSGIYHFTNSGVTSWYDFAVAIFEEAAAIGFPLKLQRVVPITTAEYPTPTQRPAYSALAWQKIAAILNSPPPHWRQGLRQMLTQLYTQTYESNYSLRR
ncbi:dTDP-4-dehydrorhamnose reductase [Thermocoleostomius sinensis]|uniref:dTDP-4-dehydrorhamnose reductase n=1 Tax=Thermocoleostomius sinensis A174 TaxID=2016057 RepID=A0A9E8ZGX0_9CYAN|nr:dTDP-4-dehydrorhamnose reductase [Thermocoleostomius sinensis]WAL62541.1 dTDP-4-dehydrorhamnose reductase [Thermocoleostomius sinensis A174]